MKKILSFALILIMLAPTPASVFAATEPDIAVTTEPVAAATSINDGGVSTMDPTALIVIDNTRSTGYTQIGASLYKNSSCTKRMYTWYTFDQATELLVFRSYINNNGDYVSLVRVMSGLLTGKTGYMFSCFIREA